MKLENKVAIVSGAASGIGRAIALNLAENGARVAVCDINLDGAEEVANEIGASGGEALALKVDVSNWPEVEANVTTVLEKFGIIDVLVNSAAYLGFQMGKAFHEEELEEWDKHINVTLKGTLHFCRAVIPHMIAQQSGRIVNITSTAAKVGDPAVPVFYPACKAGIAAVSRCLAAQLARHGILINCVAPGPIQTPALLSQPPIYLEKMAKPIPLKRLGEPEDVANMVLFLSSDDSKFITGQHYSVDGGITLF
ncbi:MAG: SDR family oxidoreductase [Chloroflexi bacterium]|nr:SDR family oxidoreductase [Chloroflexota bacterium]